MAAESETRQDEKERKQQAIALNKFRSWRAAARTMDDVRRCSGQPTGGEECRQGDHQNAAGHRGRLRWSVEAAANWSSQSQLR